MLPTSPTDPAQDWATSLLNTNHGWQTVRLGHGWDEHTDRSFAWVDIITQSGWSLAAAHGDAVLPCIPGDICEHIIHHVRLGSCQDFNR